MRPLPRAQASLADMITLSTAMARRVIPFVSLRPSKHLWPH